LLGCTVAAGTVALVGSMWWETNLGHTTVLLKIGAVFGPALAATAVYFGAALAFGIPAAAEMRELVMSRLRP